MPGPKKRQFVSATQAPILRKLKWPRVTERGLAGVLMQRDGVKG
jgi:hypothetical protein